MLVSCEVKKEIGLTFNSLVCLMFLHLIPV